MAFGDAHVFPGFPTPVLTQLFFPKPPTTFFICFCRGEGHKYVGKKVRLNRGSNSKPPGHDSNTLTTGPPQLGRERERDLQKKIRPIVQKQSDLQTGQEHLKLFSFSNICILGICICR